MRLRWRCKRLEQVGTRNRQVSARSFHSRASEIARVVNQPPHLSDKCGFFLFLFPLFRGYIVCMRIYAIIPARGGSKGVPGKNVKDLCGKPLIAWTIEAARKVPEISRIIVNTDDEDIAAEAKKH